MLMNRYEIWVAIVASGALLGCSKGPLSATRPEARIVSGIRAESDAERLVEARDQQLRAMPVKLSAYAGAAIAYHADPSVFAVPISARLFYVAAKDRSGQVTGVYAMSETVDGVTTHYAGNLTCMGVYDFDGGVANRAKIGGRIDTSDDPEQPVGRYIWWQNIDNQSSPDNLPDKSTFAGFGDEAANIAFCQSPNPPRFGPFPVDTGDIVVRVVGSGTLQESLAAE
jgi:hypothetical protein